jgi:hypothetical protein
MFVIVFLGRTKQGLRLYLAEATFTLSKLFPVILPFGVLGYSEVLTASSNKAQTVRT